MLGLGNPVMRRPLPPEPFIPSGNPTWDRMQQGDFSGDDAQRAVTLSGVPQRVSEAEAAPLGPPPAEAAPPQPMRPISGPASLNVRGLGSPTPAAQSPAPLAGAPAAPLAQDPEAVEHLKKRNDVIKQGSGISQIRSPWLRGLAHVGDAIGSAVLPNVMRFIPGTELHHRDVEAGAESAVSGDVARATAAATQGHLGSQMAQETARIPLIEAQTQEALANAKKMGQPPPAHFTPLPTDQGISAFNQQTGTATPVMAGEEQAQPFEKEGKGPVTTFQVVNGSVIALTPGLEGEEATSQVVYKGSPDVPTKVIKKTVNGKLHNVLIHGHTGATIMDLGETAQPATNVGFNPIPGVPAPQPTGDSRVDAVLAKYPQEIRSMAQGFLSYKTIMPSQRAASSPQVLAALQAAREADTDFDPKMYRAQQNLMVDMTSGRSSRENRAVNVTIGHLGNLYTAIDALRNGDLMQLNRLANFLGLQSGKDPVPVYQAIVNRVAPETVQAYLGTGGELHDRAKAAEDFNPSRSPQQLRAVILEAARLLGSKIDTTMQQWKGLFHSRPFPMPGGTVLTPAAKEVLDRIEGRGQAAQGGGVANPAADGPTRRPLSEIFK